MFFHSLKRLQVIDFITKRNLFQQLNISVPTDDFLNVINQFEKEFDPDKGSIVFYLIYERQEYISEIITPYGLCQTYNIAYSHDLLKINSTSNDFHFINSKVYKNIKRWIHSHPPEHLPQKVLTSNAGLWIGFGNKEDDEKSLELFHNTFDGYVVMFHDSFELPSKLSKTVNFNKMLQTKVLIDGKIITIDDSLYDYEPIE